MVVRVLLVYLLLLFKNSLYLLIHLGLRPVALEEVKLSYLFLIDRYPIINKQEYILVIKL